LKLTRISRFEMEDTTYNAALRSGFRSGRRGVPRSCNPYPSGSQKHRAWREGWEAADYQDEYNDVTHEHNEQYT
jgi:hypothetical protein